MNLFGISINHRTSPIELREAVYLNVDEQKSFISALKKDILKEGFVISIEPIDSTTFSAVVQGNQIYVVSVSIDQGGYILCDCSCPCDFNCKHAAAALLKWLSIKNKIDKEQLKAMNEKKETIEKILARKTKTELINLLKLVLKQYPELTSYVRINTTELILRIRNLFSQFWEEYNVKELTSQLEIILEGIRNNKDQWDIRLFQEMNTCSQVMIENQEQVFYEFELSNFLEEWFHTLGEVFSEIESTRSKKEAFIDRLRRN